MPSDTIVFSKCLDYNTAMRYFRTLWIYAKRHYDFLILDLLTYSVAYCLAVLIRLAMDIRITHGELFLKYGIVSLVVYLVVELANKNLNGVISRSPAREMETVGLQMLATWSIYTVILFLSKNAFHFSRALYLTTFFVCYVCLVIARIAMKSIVKYTRLQKAISPKLLIVCEAQRAHKVLMKLLPGTMENKYDICGIVMNEKGPADYHDWYPSALGLSHISDFISDRRVRAAYIELDDAEEEARVIQDLLSAGVIVHRSLGDSHFTYASQRINELSGVSVITIEDTRSSLVSRLEALLDKILRRKHLQ